MDGPALDPREVARGEPFGPGERFRILADRPLPQFDSPAGFACLAADTLAPERPLYALVCPNGALWRRRPLNELTKISASGVVNPIHSGALAPKGNERRFVIIFERPQGMSLADFKPKGERDVTRRILPPLLNAVLELADRGITHRAIQPGNIFFRLADQYDEILLGECVSAPPGAAQAPLFEPPERADALPEGRGEGGPEADFYALGMVIASLLTGKDLAALPQLLKTRRRAGSFVAAMGTTRAGSATEALLRGILRDEPISRWGPENVRRWRNGDEGRPTTPGTPRVAGQPIRFRGDNHDTAWSLVQSFSAFPKEAMAECMGRGPEKWLHYSLGDTAAGRRVREIREREESYPADDETVFTARVCCALEPLGPVRFRDIVVMRDGLAPLVAAAIAAGDTKRLTTLSQLFQSGLLTESAGPRPTEPATLQQNFAENLSHWAKDRALGFGMERCLYELNPLLPCQSPQTSGDCDTPAALLSEFDRRAEADRSETPSFIDRHVAAFLATQMRSYQYRLAQLARRDQSRVEALRTEVALLADYQQIYGPNPLHGLTAWAVAVLTQAIKGLHNANARGRLLERLPALARPGDVAQVVRGLNFSQWLAWDEAGYRQAQANDRALAAALDWIEAEAGPRAARAAQQAQHIANALAFAALFIACMVSSIWLAR